MPITADKRSYVAGKYAIELDGINAGWVWSVEGGHATADVVVEKMGSDHLQRKHIGNVKYEDMTVTCGTGMSKAFYTWIQDSFDHKYSRKNGAAITADFNYKEHSRINFFNALITEIGMPAQDAASKDAAKMTIKFANEYTRYLPAKGGGASIGGGKFPANAAVQKQWKNNTFRLVIDGFDCTRVNKIEALTVKQKVIEQAVGEMRDYEKEPGHVEIPNLVFTLPESHAEEVFKYHEDFVIKGNCSQDKEKGGTLTYLAQDLKTELFSLTFVQLGIFKCTPDKTDAGSEQVRRVKVEMYCEDIQFNYNSKYAFGSR